MNRNHRKKRSHCSKSRSQSIVSEKFLDDFKNIEFDRDYNQRVSTFVIKTSKQMGRYIIASKDLRAGSIILREMPLVVGPCAGCKVQCLACYQTLDPHGTYTKCSACGWPLCSQFCHGIGEEYGHSNTECAVLKETKSKNSLDYSDFQKLRESYNAVVPLRCLLKKETNPKCFETIMDMESHNVIRRNIPDLWNLNQTLVVDRIRRDWGLTEFSEEEIHSICGILEVNCFEIGQQGINIRGLYPTAFLMSHDCVPNTNHTDEEKNYRLTVRASVNIYSNQPITLSYAYTLQSTLKRREHLLENKFFECKCSRCKDPTEFGTNTGALRCPKCKQGLVLSTDPLDPEATWSCNNSTKIVENRCPGYTITAKSMQLLISRISSEAENLDCNDVEGMEEFLQKYRNVLHPTHYICLGLKLSLSQLYGKINGYIIHQLTDEQLQRKMDICREIIKIFDVVEPGYTRVRGVTLYELHAPLMILTSRHFENQTISKSRLKQQLREVAKYLEEACVILSFEPETSTEGMMGVAAREALLKVKDWGKVIGKL